MEDSIIPTATAWRISRIVANHVEHGLGGADAKRLCILRHKKHMAALFDSDFVNKFREALGARQVQGAAGLASMPVSTRDEHPPPEPGQFGDAVVFAAATGSVEFKGVQEPDVNLQESPEDLRVSSWPHAAQIPEGMVKDQEHFGAL